MAATKKAMTRVTDITDREDKRKALNTAMAQIEKEFGAGAIMKLGENSRMEVQAVSTGSLSRHGARNRRRTEGKNSGDIWP